MLSALQPNDPTEIAAYLRTLPAIRERCGQVFDLAKAEKLQYFEYHPEKEDTVTEFCDALISRDFGEDVSKIPPHGRWRHLDAGRERVEPLIKSWKADSNPPDDLEVTRRLLDLFLVSVLLDAGAGADWVYNETPSNDEGFTAASYSRSEGLGVASVKMFADGAFSGVDGQPFRVDAKGLASISPTTVGKAMQVNESNPMVGLDGRAGLLHSLSSALSSNPEFFGPDGRPGGLVDFLLKTAKPSTTPTTTHVSALWAALIEGLATIWPRGGGRTELGGKLLGDVWPCAALAATGAKDGAELVPFHKLTGWTTYSLLEPLQKVLGWKIEGVEDMTGLPEYRNGGLLLDHGVLSLKPGALSSDLYPNGPSQPPHIPPSHPAIIEWRALTVILLDRIAASIRKRRGLSVEQLTLAQVLEACTWKGGREIAKQLRPNGGGPPIEIISDGTVF